MVSFCPANLSCPLFSLILFSLQLKHSLSFSFLSAAHSTYVLIMAGTGSYISILSLTGIVSVLLISFGSWTFHNKRCPVAPSLPIWMISAGFLVALFTLLTGGLLIWRQNLLSKKKTLFCLGIFMVLGCLIWLAFWITGTYFSIVAFESVRVHQWSENVDKRTFLACDSATLAVAGFCLAFIWILSAVACVRGIFSVFAKRRMEYRQVIQNGTPN